MPDSQQGPAGPSFAKALMQIHGESGPDYPLVAAAQSALQHSSTTVPGSGRRGGSFIDAASRQLLSAFSPKPRTQAAWQRCAEIGPMSTGVEANQWFTETLHGYRLDPRATQPWVDRFVQNRMDGASLLSITNEADLRDVFGIELKGVRTRLLQDIDHERENQAIHDATTTMDAMVRQTSHIIFAVVAAGYLLMVLSAVLVPLVLSFALFMFLLPVVDKLSVRPTRCCTSTYPAYCIDGYEQCAPGGAMQNRSRGRRRARCYRGLLLCIFPRPIAVLLAVCLVLCVVAVVGFVVAASLVDAVDSADVYIAKLDDILNSTRLWMYDLGMNDTDIDNLYGQIPATAVAVGGVTTLGGAVVDFCIILLFATYLCIEQRGTRQAPGYINARVYKLFIEPFNPQRTGRRNRLSPEHKLLNQHTQRKLREHFDTLIRAFDGFDLKGDGLLSSDQFRLGLTKISSAPSMATADVTRRSGVFNITEVNALRDALLKIHEAYRDEKKSTFRARLRDDLSSYMYWKVLFSTITGVSTALALLGFQVDLWAMYGVLSFALNFIPTLGGLIMSLLTIPMLIVDPDVDFLEAVAAFCCVLGVHGLVSSVIEPIIYGRRYEVHPVAVVVALTIWVSLWGFIGALISTPFLIFLRITLEDQVHPVAQGLFSIIRGRPVGDSIATAQSTGANGVDKETGYLDTVNE